METPLWKSPCSDLESDLLEMLREAAKMQMGHGLDHDSKTMGRARELAQRRFEKTQRRREEAEEELEELEADLFQQALSELLESDKGIDQILGEVELNEERRRLRMEIDELSRESQRITRSDLDEALSEFEEKGLIDTSKQTIRLTSRGARLLGQGVLTHILESLMRRGVGPHRTEEIGHGTWLCPACRPYEHGDPYDRINIEKTMLASLERDGGASGPQLTDVRVHESIHSTEVHFGILVDQSGSMNRDGKMEAAVETALALSELMRTQFPEDRLHLFAFSEEVRRVEPWELPCLAVPVKYTDIQAAMRVFRLAVAHETGNKQVHLITDSAPNFEDGEFVGFDAGLAGVLGEARRYRAEGILLNIVMLDEDPELKDMAKAIAKQNLGRVFFTRPSDLGRFLVEDYLLSRRETPHL